MIYLPACELDGNVDSRFWTQNNHFAFGQTEVACVAPSQHSVVGERLRARILESHLLNNKIHDQSTTMYRCDNFKLPLKKSLKMRGNLKSLHRCIHLHLHAHVAKCLNNR